MTAQYGPSPLGICRARRDQFDEPDQYTFVQNVSKVTFFPFGCQGKKSLKKLKDHIRIITVKFNEIRRICILTDKRKASYFLIFSTYEQLEKRYMYVPVMTMAGTFSETLVLPHVRHTRRPFGKVRHNSRIELWLGCM